MNDWIKIDKGKNEEIKYLKSIIESLKWNHEEQMKVIEKLNHDLNEREEQEQNYEDQNKWSRQGQERAWFESNHLPGKY